MGGSGLAGALAKSLYEQQMTMPIQVNNGYSVAPSVNRSTLYIPISYSGTTEEIVRSLPAARRQGATIVGISGGGALGTAVRKKQIAGYVFDPIHNPSGQPRQGLGYTLFGLLGILRQAGLIRLSDSAVKTALSHVDRLARTWDTAVPTAKNPAKKLALALADRAVCTVAAEPLVANAHVFTNQVNESAKTFATYFALPELNHHLLEGLAKPRAIKKTLSFLFIDSPLYFARNRRRLAITQEVVENHGIPFVTHTVQGVTALEQAGELLVFGGYVSYYLAILNGVNPVAIPWVDYFKQQLEKKPTRGGR